MNKTKVKIISVMSVLVVCLLIVGAFQDMSISDGLFLGGDSLIALLGGFIGKLPAFVMLAVAFAILLSYVKTNANNYKKGIKTLLYVVYILAILASFVLAFYSAFEELTSKAKYIAVVAGLLATCITALVVFKRDIKHLEELKKWALLTIIAIGAIIIVTTLLKSVWGRFRYNSITIDGEKFTPWYIPQGFTGGHSFPSGHTALWGALYMLIPLLGIFGYKGEGKLFALIIISQLMVGLFRVVGGYHFLSDITFAMAVSFTSCIVTMSVGYKPDYSNKVLSERNIFRHI